MQTDYFKWPVNYSHFPKETLDEISEITFGFPYRPEVLMFGKEMVFRHRLLIKDNEFQEVDVQFNEQMDVALYKHFVIFSPGLVESVKDGVEAIALRIYNTSKRDLDPIPMMDMASAFAVNSKGEIFYFNQRSRDHHNVSSFCSNEFH